MTKYRRGHTVRFTPHSFKYNPINTKYLLPPPDFSYINYIIHSEESWSSPHDSDVELSRSSVGHRHGRLCRHGRPFRSPPRKVLPSHLPNSSKPTPQILLIFRYNNYNPHTQTHLIINLICLVFLELINLQFGVTGSKKKKKKKVKFAEDVKEPKGNGELYRKAGSKRSEIQKKSCGNELKKMPANHAALYNGILKHRMGCSY